MTNRLVGHQPTLREWLDAHYPMTHSIQQEQDMTKGHQHIHPPGDPEHQPVICPDCGHPDGHADECERNPWRRLAIRLAEAEATYRITHDTRGDGHIETGRAWDKLRQAGDALRRELGHLTGEKT